MYILNIVQYSREYQDYFYNTRKEISINSTTSTTMLVNFACVIITTEKTLKFTIT